MPEITVIIPNYNAGQKLVRCLDSLLSQDFTDFTCIVVDDGSTDDSVAICEQYANRDPRIKVIQSTNKGVSTARNIGLDHAAPSEWIVFVDSDDYLNGNHLSCLLKKASPAVDLVLCGHKVFFADSIKTHSYREACYLSIDDMARFLCNGDVISHMTPWDKMFRHEVIQQHHLRFDPALPISEDRLFCYQFLLHARGIATNSDITYLHDRTSTASLSSRIHSFETLAYRCEKFNEETERILGLYSINTDDAYVFIRVCWNMYKFAVFEALSEKGAFSAVGHQRRLRGRCSGYSWFPVNDKKQSQFIENREDRQIAKGDFLLLNLITVIKRLLKSM